jgi:hypothetical protein
MAEQDALTLDQRRKVEEFVEEEVGLFVLAFVLQVLRRRRAPPPA